MGADPNRGLHLRETLREAWRDFITSGIPDDPFSPYMRRVRFLNQFLLTTDIALLLFGAVNLAHGAYLGAAVEITVGFMATGVLVYLRKTSNLDRGQKITLCMMLVIMVYLLLSGGIQGTGIFWWFTLPAGAFFLGRRFARWWMAATAAMILLAMGLAAAGVLHLPYSLVFLRQFLASLLVVSFLVYFYESLREDYEELIEVHSCEIISTNEHLLREICERRKAQEDLENARLDAERANQAKSEFLSRMSHELRTPMNSILGFSQLMESDTREPLTPTQRENVELILAGGRHLLTLINEVLDLSRIEAGRLSLSIEPIDVRDVISDGLSVVKPLADGRSVTIRDETAGASIPKILADPYRFKQVLLNLLSNAIKYNREGGLVVVSATVPKSGTLRVSVMDTGPGIPPDKQPLLFEPFQRLSAERSTIEGTGIGLTIAKKLMEAMRGEIGVTSTLGLGSCFYMDLPAEEGAEMPEPVLAAPAGAAADQPQESPRGVGTVLYVEDDTANVTLVRHVLARRPGIQLLAATRGDDGLELAKAHRPALILLDIHLPDMHGQEIFQRLQDDPNTRDIPVIIVSASAMPGDIEKLLDMGVAKYLTKPFDLTRFLETLDEYMPPATPGAPMGVPDDTR